MKQYIPKPVDTSDVVLDPAILELGEALARNTHEVWAAGRLEDGWTWGPERDDAKRHHPCIIPYEELSEEEKDFDRRTATQTLKLIQKLGFKIVKE